MVTNSSEHVPVRQADGTGRDGYIHFGNGGLYNKYKGPSFDLRAYEVINKPRFGKVCPEFDDYQHWYDQKNAK